MKYDCASEAKTISKPWGMRYEALNKHMRKYSLDNGEYVKKRVSILNQYHRDCERTAFKKGLSLAIGKASAQYVLDHKSTWKWIILCLKDLGYVFEHNIYYHIFQKNDFVVYHHGEEIGRFEI